MRSNSVVNACLAVVVWTSGAVAQQPADPVSPSDFDYPAMAKSIDATTKALEAVRADIHRDRFATDPLLDTLDYEVASAVRFVREEIVFQPYDGVLRGVDGTLRAGSGNSLDQSILLASLLKSAGFDARVVRGTLAEHDAIRLLRSLKPAALPSSMAYLDSSISRLFGAAAADDPATVSMGDSAMAGTARMLASGLRKVLEQGGVTLAPVDVQAAWLPMVRRYFWVEYRESSSEAWQEAHPAFGSETAPDGLSPEEYFAESVPETYQHKITVSAWIEQWSGGKITQQRVMAPWTRPVANLDAGTIRYRNIPSGLNLQDAANLDKVLNDSQIFIPMLNDERAPGAMAFDLQGRTIDPMVIGASGGGMTGIFKTMGDLMANATDGVMAREDQQPVLALHSMWLEFTFTTPGGEEFTQRRYLIAPRADHSTANQSLLWPLITDHTYMINAGGQPLDYVAERFLATAIENSTWQKTIVRHFLNPEQPITEPGNALPVDFPPLAQFWFMAGNPLAERDLVSFRARPAMLGLRRGFLDAKTAFASIDIVANGMEHVRVTATGIDSVPSAALQQGVWDTVTESLPQKALSVAADGSSSTIRTFQLAGEQGIAIRLLQPGQGDAVAGLGLDAGAVEFITADLSQGYAVLVPQRPPEGTTMAGWWRVDPITGETLGMTGDGRGQDLVEYLTEVTGIAFNMVQALQALKDCDKQANDVAKMCCLVEANINNVAGLGFGGFMGAAVGTAGGALFDIVNYGTSLATEAAFGQAQGLMPQAKLGCDKMAATAW